MMMLEHPTDDSPYAHINLSPCYFKPDRLGLRPFCEYDYMDTDLYFHGLTITNQISSTHRDFEFSYAWSYEYRLIHSLNPNICEQMHKTFTTIKRRYKALERKMGSPFTYGQYVAYIANCLKIDKLARNYPDGGYDLMTMGDAIAYIDLKDKQLHEECIAHLNAHAH